MAGVTDPKPGSPATDRPGIEAEGIYSLVVTASVIATAGDKLRTVALALAVVLTLFVYWLAEQYAEYGEHLARGHAPSTSHARRQLGSKWQLITASFVPLACLLVARLLGASAYAAAMTALVVTVVLLMVYGWRAGRYAGLRGPAQALMTVVAGVLGILMIVLKIALGHLH